MNLPANFLNDIQGKNTSLIPLVVFNDSNVYISTNNITVDGNYYQPILLNIPSIKQSVDIENRRFKISSVTLSISNYEYGGKIFSDLLETTSMINQSVSVYWKSPSSTTINANQDTDCPLIYQGQIRRVSHDTEKVSVELEDLTESKAHRDLPQTVTGDHDLILDKYKNKPIPMVYGGIDNSPTVIVENHLMMDTELITIFPELSDQTLDVNISPVNVFDQSYANVPSTMEKGIEGSFVTAFGEIYPVESQWVEINDGVTARIKLNQSVLFTLNGLQVRSIYAPPSIRLKNWNPTYWYNNNEHLEEFEDENTSLLVDKNPHSSIDIVAEYHWADGYYNYNPFIGNFGWFFDLIFNLNPPYAIKSPIAETYVALNGYKLPKAPIYPNYHFMAQDDLSNWTEDGYSENYSNLLQIYQSGTFDQENEENYLESGADIDFYAASYGNYPITAKMKITEKDGEYLFRFGGDTDPLTAGEGEEGSMIGPVGNLVGKFKEVLVSTLADIENPLGKDFFVRVAGRKYNGEYAVNPATIIRHILEVELGYTDFDEADYDEAVEQHSFPIQFAFTVHDKQISSKKLIEDIAKSTLMFPHFSNDGAFRFNTIRQDYENYTDYEVIPESEIIDYSFSKTKPEQIYTKFEVDYNYDYAQKDYLKKVNTDFSIGDGNHLSYYGYENSDDNIGKLQSAYIRDSGTAEKVNELLFHYYKNQHLILKLKLPIKYIGLSVGDVIKFDELLGGITAYGIDYTKTTELNGQRIYPYFFITSLQKNIDSVQVELIQLHYIESETATEPIVGCTDPNATNYNADATEGDNSCTYDIPAEDTSPENMGFQSYIEFGEVNNYEQYIIFNDFYKSMELESVESGGELFDYIGPNLVDPDVGDPSSENINSALIGTSGYPDLAPPIEYNLQTLFSFGGNVSPEFSQTFFRGMVAVDLLPLTEPYSDDAFFNESQWIFTVDEVLAMPDSDGNGGQFRLMAGLFYNKTSNTLDWNFYENAGIAPSMPSQYISEILDFNDNDSSTKLRLKFHNTNYWNTEGESLWYKAPSLVYGVHAVDPINFPLVTGVEGLNCGAGYFGYENETEGYSIGCYRMGDINNDGVLNILDIVGVVNFVMGISTPDGLQAAVADVNEDGMINVLDVVSIINIILSS